MKPLAECRLYTFIDSQYLGDRSVPQVTRQLCDGGSDLIQLRAKTTPIEEIRRMAWAMREITARFEVRLVINDHPAIAAEVGADLCHLGQEDFFAAGHRHISELQQPGSRIPVGLSTHAPDQARQAVAAGAEYLAVGPVFPTGTKPRARPVTLDYVSWAASHLDLPWFAIGGINLDNLAAVLNAGARRVAVVSAILNSGDVVQTCQRFGDRLASVAT